MILSDPFATLFELQQELDATRANDWLQASPSAAGSYPPINVFRKSDDFVVVAELPGIQKSDLDVQVKGNTIRIAGKKSIDYSAETSVHRRERLAGRFDRTIALPVQIDPDQVKADYDDGVLTLILPRAEQDKPRSIKLN